MVACVIGDGSIIASGMPDTSAMVVAAQAIVKTKAPAEAGALS